MPMDNLAPTQDDTDSNIGEDEPNLCKLRVIKLIDAHIQADGIGEGYKVDSYLRELGEHPSRAMPEVVAAIARAAALARKCGAEQSERYRTAGGSLFERLPVEIYLHIASFLDDQSTTYPLLSDLSKAMLICPNLTAAVMPLRWKSFNSSTAEHICDTQSFSVLVELVERIGRHVQVLKTCLRPDASEYIVVPYLKHLRTLSVDAYEVEEAELAALSNSLRAGTARTVEQLELNGLGGNYSSRDPGPVSSFKVCAYFAASLPNLRHLDISFCVAPARPLCTHLFFALSHLKHLKSLHIGLGPGGISPFPGEYHPLPWILPANGFLVLQHLTLAGVDWSGLYGRSLVHLLGARIRLLRLSDVHDATVSNPANQPSFPPLGPSLPNLAVVEWIDSKSTGDDAIRVLADLAGAPALRKVALWVCGDLTSRMVDPIMDALVALPALGEFSFSARHTLATTLRVLEEWLHSRGVRARLNVSAFGTKEVWLDSDESDVESD